MISITKTSTNIPACLLEEATKNIRNARGNCDADCQTAASWRVPPFAFALDVGVTAQFAGTAWMRDGS